LVAPHQDAAINDSTAARVWKFNRFTITSNNVPTLGATVGADDNNANVPTPKTYTTPSANHTPPYMDIV